MCGIFGILSKSDSDISGKIIKGIKALEHRGYDSTGIATIDKESKSIECLKVCGTVNLLEDQMLRQKKQIKYLAIGHTRWATHGKIELRNAHPHLSSNNVAIVHNGIIENYIELKEEIKKNNKQYIGETDSEAIAHMFAINLEKKTNLREALEATARCLKGHWSALIISKLYPDLILALKNGTPMVIGECDNGDTIITSDVLTISHFSNKVTFLEDGDYAIIDNYGKSIYNNATEVYRKRKMIETTISLSNTNNQISFILQEIYHQPIAVNKTANQFIKNGKIQLPIKLDSIKQISIVACGSSYYAGMLGKYWIEASTGIPTGVSIASEFRYSGLIDKNTTFIFISQSGETADTLESLKHVKKHGNKIIGITNSMYNSISRLSDISLDTVAGTEISVAATKTFTSQLTVLQCLTIYLAGKTNMVQELLALPDKLKTTIDTTIRNIDKATEAVINSKAVLFIGRGESYCVAMEGALKLKELAYLNAISIAAGELKHGTLALVDENVPIIAIIPSDKLFIKTLSNIQEAYARGAKIIAVTDKIGTPHLEKICHSIIEVPCSNTMLSAFLTTIPLQLIAYKAAIFQGIDADKPRNLAKSVTVE